MLDCVETSNFNLNLRVVTDNNREEVRAIVYEEMMNYT